MKIAYSHNLNVAFNQNNEITKWNILVAISADCIETKYDLFDWLADFYIVVRVSTYKLTVLLF